MESRIYQPLFPDKKVSQRTGKTTFAAVGFAPTTRSLTPWDDPDTIIMGLNEAYVHNFMKRWDIWLQIHSQRNFMRPDNDNDPGHRYWLLREWEQWLQARKGSLNPNPTLEKRVVEFMESHPNIPILMQRQYAEIPNAVEYPLQNAKLLVPETIRKHNGGRYFTSSAAFMLGWAMLEGFERIEFYGFEMASSTEYIRQRPAFEFWLALAAMSGIEIYLPSVCGILKDKMYGFERMSVGFEQKLEMMNTDLVNQRENNQIIFHHLVGAREAVKTFAEHKWSDPKAEYDRLQLELEKQQNVVMQVEGAKRQMDHVVEFYRTYPFEEDEGDFSEREAKERFE